MRAGLCLAFNAFIAKGRIAEWAEKGYSLFGKDIGQVKVVK